MAKNHDIIELEVFVKHETDKAYLADGDHGDAWLPKSQVELEGDYNMPGKYMIQLPEWLAIDKGLI